MLVLWRLQEAGLIACIFERLVDIGSEIETLIHVYLKCSLMHSDIYIDRDA